MTEAAAKPPTATVAAVRPIAAALPMPFRMSPSFSNLPPVFSAALPRFSTSGLAPFAASPTSSAASVASPAPRTKSMNRLLAWSIAPPRPFLMVSIGCVNPSLMLLAPDTTLSLMPVILVTTFSLRSVTLSPIWVMAPPTPERRDEEKLLPLSIPARNDLRKAEPIPSASSSRSPMSSVRSRIFRLASSVSTSISMSGGSWPRLVTRSAKS